MSIKDSILQYELCIMCDVNLAKLGSSYCKKCKIKPIRNRFKNDGSTKIYYYKFQDKNNKARLRLVNSKSSDIGYSLCIQPSTPNTRGFRPIENSELFLLPTWNQFRSLKEFASCIIQSDQISFAYFIISCSSLIQNLPKFQHFIKTRAIDLPPNSECQNLILPFPLTNYLNLLCQASFWDDLISIYFHEFHPMYPLFSIRSFDKKTASPTLLSAIYFCAYQFRKQHKNEISEYIDKLAAKNIKKIVKNATIDNARALVIHMFIAKLGGNLALVKSLQAHLSRISYLLGLHLSCSKMSSIDLYNRNLLFHVARTVNIGISGSHNFAPNYLTEFGNEDSNLYDPKWQLPNRHAPIYFENPLENQLYSLCLTQFFKFTDTSARTIWFPSFYNKEIDTFINIWASKIDVVKTVYEEIIQTLEELKLNYSEFKQKVESFEIHVRMGYHEVMIEMYEILKHKNKLLQPGDITSILHHCHELSNVITTANSYSPYFQVFSHIVGLHYLNVYPKCTEIQKQITKQKLQGLILFMKDKFLQHFSLNYLILKTGYDLLDEN